MTTWRMTPNGRRRWYVSAHGAYAAAMTEGDELTEEESGRLDAALREIDAKKAVTGDDTVHYAPGGSPLCGEDVVDALCTYEPEAVAGCMPCLEFVAEDLADHHFHQGTCLHCWEKISAQGGVEWRRAVRRPCPHCGKQGW